MTMPATAAKMSEFDALPEWLDERQLHEAIAALDVDLPGATAFIARAAVKSAAADGGFVYFSCSPGEMNSKEEWSVLVGYLARLFASPFVRIVQEWTTRQYGVKVGFVNCCIVMAQQGKIDDDKAFALQMSQQLTPDC